MSSATSGAIPAWDGGRPKTRRSLALFVSVAVTALIVASGELPVPGSESAEKLRLAMLSPLVALTSDEGFAWWRAAPRGPAADRALEPGRDLLPSGVLAVPPSFRSHDGRFDLLIHFHGNAELVAESVAEAKLDALVMIVNLGISAGDYEGWLCAPGALDRLVEQVRNGVSKRGLERPQLERVALSAWSAGYAGVRCFLAHDGARIDAVLLMDGLHAPFSDPQARTPDRERLAPFARFARRAASGEVLYVMTHSEVGTFGYATSAESADAIIAESGAIRSGVKPDGIWPPRVRFDAARRAIPRGHDSLLSSTSEAHVGEPHVYGFSGDRAEHHIDHLVHMSVTVLPPLVERYNRAISHER